MSYNLSLDTMAALERFQKPKPLEGLTKTPTAIFLPQWKSFATCIDPLIDMYPESIKEEVRLRDAYCSNCPVRDMCSLTTQQAELLGKSANIWGVAGGMTSEERKTAFRKKTHVDEIGSLQEDIARKSSLQQEAITKNPNLIVEFGKVAESAKIRARAAYETEDPAQTRKQTFIIKYGESSLAREGETVSDYYTRLLKEIEQGNRVDVPDFKSLEKLLGLPLGTCGYQLKKAQLFDRVRPLTHAEVRRSQAGAIIESALIEAETGGQTFPSATTLADQTHYSVHRIRKLLKTSEFQERIKALQSN